MVCQVTLSSEGLVTTIELAKVRLLSRVDSHMGLQVATLCEGLTTLWETAHKRLVTSLQLTYM
jgi:hypothetical protein